MPILDANCIY